VCPNFSLDKWGQPPLRSTHSFQSSMSIFWPERAHDKLLTIANTQLSYTMSAGITTDRLRFPTRVTLRTNGEASVIFFNCVSYLTNFGLTGLLVVLTRSYFLTMSPTQSSLPYGVPLVIECRICSRSFSFKIVLTDSR